MDLTKILAISGKPGLFQMLSQVKAGFIVESLIDGKRFPVFAHERVSTLEEISIFTTGEDDLPLKDVFQKIFDKLQGEPGPGVKAGNDELKKLFLEAVPDYDQERVYVSDMRKTITWYNLLLEKNLLDFTEKAEETSEKEDKAVDTNEDVAGEGEAEPGESA